MKTDAPDINKQHLITMLNAEYGLIVASLHFVPKGEDAYAYIAHTQEGERFFVRAQPPAPGLPNLEQTYAITHALHGRPGLQHVVAPIATRRKTYTVQYGEYSVAVFPFLDGHTLYEGGATENDLQQAAALLAAVHTCPADQLGSALPQERFDNPFQPSILQALDVAANPPAHATIPQQRVCRLLNAERADVLHTLHLMEQMQTQAQTLQISRVVTHGDPNLDNFLKDPAGTLHLTDWGEVALGPPERDLMFFTGEHFAVFLQHYANLCPDLTLHRDLFMFYFYRWTMQEISSYGARMLLTELGPTREEHAWAELQPYLPIRPADIAQSVQNVQDVIKQVLS